MFDIFIIAFLLGLIKRVKAKIIFIPQRFEKETDVVVSI